MRILVLLALAGCDNGLTGLTQTDDDTSDVGVDSDTVDDLDTESDTEPEVDTEADTDPPPPPIVRFIAIGDAGANPENQAEVADAAQAFCSFRGCDFALYLGDNFYQTGASSYTDPRFQTNFEIPYANLDFPFYGVLGNHDLGGDGLGLDWDQDKANYQIDYTAQSSKWTMPSEYYVMHDGMPHPRADAVPEETLTLFGLDTTRMFFGNTLGTQQVQTDWLAGELAASSSPWKVGFGHHPYVSNGRHGNAGAYEGLTDLLDFIGINEIIRGQYVKTFFDTTACGELDVYFSGHDHNRQILPEPSGCDTVFVVSGAGAKHSDFHDGGLRPVNDTEFQDDQENGFVWAEINGNQLTLYVVDADGDEHGPYMHFR